MTPSQRAVRAARQFATDLAAILGPRLHSLVLYGSAARDEFAPGWSDVNVLVFAEDIDAPLLADAATVLQRHKDARVAPLLLRWEERVRAADAFAVELLDMQDAHVLLLGDEPFEGSLVPLSALRLQAERELRSRLATLDSRLLWVAQDNGAIGQLLAVALPSFVTYVRAALRLAGQAVPGAMRDVISRGTELVNAPADGLLAALDARAASSPWQPSLADPVVSHYRVAVQRTASWVDSIERELR